MKKISSLSSYFTRTRMTLAVKAVTIIAAAAALFSQDLIILFNEALRDETTSYLLAIPFLFVYLVYRKRKMLRAVATFEASSHQGMTKYLRTVAGILLSAIAILLYWHGSYTFSPLEYHILALPIFIGGMTLFLFNSATLRQLALPIVFVVLLVPPPATVIYNLGATLSIVSSEVSNAIVTAFGLTSVISSEYGNPIMLLTRSNGEVVQFTLDIACSGIYSILGFLVFAAFIAAIAEGKLWKRAAIVAIGIMLVYLLNIARITFILFIGYSYGAETALQAFHLFGGWVLTFAGTLLLLVTSGRILRIRMFSRYEAPKQCLHISKLAAHPRGFFCSCGAVLRYRNAELNRADIAKIATTAIVVALLLSIQTPVFAFKEGPPSVILQTPSGDQVATLILPEISGYELRFVYRDTVFEQMTKQDASLVYAYVPNDKTKKVSWVTLEIASTRSSMHKWEYCLVTWPQIRGRQPEVVQLDLRDIQILKNPPIMARYFAFLYTETNETQVVLYWFERPTFQTGVSSEQKYAKISVTAYLNSPETIQEVEDQLATIAVAITQYWQPIKTWTDLAMLVSRYGSSLASVATGILVIIVAVSAVVEVRARRANASIYVKLSESSKRIVDAVREAEKKSVPTLDAVALKYYEANEEVDKEVLLRGLSSMEKLGLVGEHIASIHDKPVQTWKTYITFAKLNY